MTSLISGRSLLMRPSISVAWAWASASEVRVERQVRNARSPSAGPRKRSSRGGGPVCSGTIRRQRRVAGHALCPRRPRRAARDASARCRPRAESSIAPRPRSRPRGRPRAAGRRAASGEARPRSTLHAKNAQVVDLTHARHPLRRRHRPLAKRRLGPLRLDVDDDVALAAAPPARRPRPRRPPRGPGPPRRPATRRSRHPRSASRGRAHAQPPQLDPGSAPMAASAASSASGRNAVHQHVDVDAHQPSRGDQHEPGHEQRRNRVRPW